jgi:hypothetical protein
VAFEEALDFGLVRFIVRLAPRVKEARRVDEVEPIDERVLVESHILRR